MRELSLEGELAMPKGRRLGAEQIVTKPRQIEVLQGQGKNIAAACKEIGTMEQTFYRRRKEYGGLNVDQAKRERAAVEACRHLSLKEAGGCEISPRGKL